MYKKEERKGQKGEKRIRRKSDGDDKTKERITKKD